MHSPAISHRFTMFPVVMLALLSLVLMGCSRGENGASADDDSAGGETSDATSDDETAERSTDRPNMSDEALAAGLDDLATEANNASTICELMELGIAPVLMVEPTTEDQAQSMLEFYVVMYERMAAIVDDQAHSEALADLAAWFNGNLSESGRVLESINSGQELEGVATPEVEAAMEYVGNQSIACSATVSNDSVSEIDGE